MARRSEYRGTDRSRAPRRRKVTVKEENTLLPFLFGLLNEQSKSSVKALLAHGQISVNGTVTSQFNTPLTPGDEVLISYERGKVEFNNPLLTIVGKTTTDSRKQERRLTFGFQHAREGTDSSSSAQRICQEDRST